MDTVFALRKSESGQNCNTLKTVTCTIWNTEQKAITAFFCDGEWSYLLQT